MTPIETINYKGFDIKIFRDECGESPDSWGDESLFLVGFSSRYLWIIREGLKHPQDIGNWKKDYHIFPLYAYIHSGVALSMGRGGQFSDPSDSSQVGFVLASKKEFKTNEKAMEISKGLVNTWNQYLSGKVYGYSIDEPVNDSCWGYYGDYEESGLMESAKGAIDFILKMNARKGLKRQRHI